MLKPLVIEHLGRDAPRGFWGKKVTLIDDVSFSVEGGKVVGFIGKNGAGKTTTMRTIVGLAKVSRGSVRVFGEDPVNPVARRQVGYLPESPTLAPSLTLVETLRLHSALAGVAADEALLERVGLAQHRRSLIGTFSKGMKTRASLALVLLGQPKLLVLDEPMSGLDPAGRHLVRTLIADAAKEGTAVLFSSHVLADVEALSNSVVVIDKGKVVHEGPTVVEGDGWEIHVRPTLTTKTRECHRKENGLDVFVTNDDPLVEAAALRELGYEIRQICPTSISLDAVVRGVLEI